MRLPSVKLPSRDQILDLVRDLPHTAEVVTREVERQAQLAMDVAVKIRGVLATVRAVREGRIKISVEPPEDDQ